MTRTLLLVIATCTFAGCECSGRSNMDPFVGRTTVPPPPTGITAPQPANPYYQGPPPGPPGTLQPIPQAGSPQTSTPQLMPQTSPGPTPIPAYPNNATPSYPVGPAGPSPAGSGGTSPIPAAAPRRRRAVTTRIAARRTPRRHAAMRPIRPSSRRMPGRASPARRRATWSAFRFLPVAVSPTARRPGPPTSRRPRWPTAARCFARCCRPREASRPAMTGSPMPAGLPAARRRDIMDLPPSAGSR